jgi:N-ethylmaleimide reductase
MEDLLKGKFGLAIEVASAVADEIGAGSTGIRISPGNTFNDIAENDVYTVYAPLSRELSRLELAYLHVAHMGDEILLRRIRSIWPGVLVLNRGGLTFQPGLRISITVPRM